MGERFGKDDLGLALQHHLGMNPTQAEKTIMILTKTIIFALKSGKVVHLPNIGVISVKYMHERRGVQVGKNRIALIKERIKPNFRYSKTLRRMLNLNVELMKLRLSNKR